MEILIDFRNNVLLDTAKIRSEILKELKIYFEETVTDTTLLSSIDYKGLLFMW